MQLFSFFLCYDQQNVQLSILGLGEVYLTELKFIQGVRLFTGVYPKLNEWHRLGQKKDERALQVVGTACTNVMS